MARLTTKLRYGLANLFAKSANIAFLSEWVKTSFLEPTFHRLTSEGFNANAAVFACVSALVFKWNEPPPRVVNRRGEPQENTPLQKLLDRPNPLMSHAELMNYTMQYRAIGGQCYLHKVRGRAGQIVELWPYHSGQVSPIPSRFDWIAEYEFDDGDGNKTKAPREDVIHLKWPIVDLSQPWMALPPLKGIAREVDTDSEMTRYLYALLKNDATPRTILNVKTSLSDPQFERLRQQFSIRHGGDNRGGVGIVEGEATISRMSLNLQELAFDAMRRVPESRIAGAFRVPAILAGLYVGLEHATYANFREARAQLTEDTFVPLWKADGQELTQALAGEFPGDLRVEYDLSQVAALQEDQTEKVNRSVALFEKNGVVLDELRAMIGLPPIEQVVPGDERGLFFSYELRAPAPPVPQPQIIDALVEEPPRQLTDDQKHRAYTGKTEMLDPNQTQPLDMAVKARRDDATADVQRRMQVEAEAYVRSKFEAAANA